MRGAALRPQCSFLCGVRSGAGRACAIASPPLATPTQTVRLAVDPTALRMEVEEQERHTRLAPPPERVSVAEVGDGADELGVHLMRRLTNQVEVETAGAATRVRLIKLRRPAPAAPRR